ncbi:hypothetical protein HRR83_003749 [Exophiala dermatitidis]|uniref:Integral membrane protein n=3 Tax=Exophiala dermatitidis TaxID=5970 RepID=H6BP88_EXODN|nr:uncharacterized protein HMPREF1120_01732 [Exophiala dermatitidis NIH/UT8656]KAJ4518949.1 hypothetical protein HRR75_002625 [Exophiala dermatitidis]EHY53543.1 hypothetical protein HMPREF1120_01732 [Exophiala dermatitidis NIH/UT8656]KAJ4522286.1 hypothetical protein HRR74_002869 [Exophiala dermatitidis]KAJ4529611.1 hypothetical protein HRR73_000637 [Exophiala dermatitidis]KAJ4543225.1 hypothetical protein HRR77_005482 [Exophiala dermatitidis]
MPARSRHFKRRQPFEHDNSLILERAEGPVGFFNPTRAHFLYPTVSRVKSHIKNDVQDTDDSVRDRIKDEKKEHESPEPAKNVRFLWRSRDNRKGRHALLVQRPAPGEESSFLTPRSTSDPREILRNVKRTLTYFPFWDVSWLVAFIFTWGSVVWVINGFFAWLPLEAPSTEFHNEILYGGGITAFIGAIIFFETGSILLIIEAVNVDHAGCFGWAVEQLMDEQGGGGGKAKYRLKPSKSHCRHHHQNRHNFVGKSAAAIEQHTGLAQEKSEQEQKQDRQWQWFPSWHDLRTHYLHELGFLAGAAQLFGATVFGVSGFTALPGINDRLSPQSALNGAYWIPQVIGGSGFIVSSTLYMLETQSKWYKPALKILGWHIAFWNLIGAIGFTLCGALGMAYGNSGAQYQASLATFWGSWAFLIGSYLQLYESLDKHPVEETSKKEDTPKQ